MDGSAAVIGEMMLPILEPTRPGRPATTPATSASPSSSPTSSATSPRTSTGAASTCPQEDLARFGADPAPAGGRRGVARRSCASRSTAAATLYRSADLGIALLPPSSARCIRAARDLYSADPRPHRGGRLRRVHDARVGADVAQGRGGRRRDRSPEPVTHVLLVAAWLAGTVLLWRLPALPIRTAREVGRRSRSSSRPATRQRTLPTLLASLQQQVVPAAEIVVVDDGSTDGTAACRRRARGAGRDGPDAAGRVGGQALGLPRRRRHATRPRLAVPRRRRPPRSRSDRPLAAAHDAAGSCRCSRTTRSSGPTSSCPPSPTSSRSWPAASPRCGRRPNRGSRSARAC